MKEADIAASLLTMDDHPQLNMDVLTALYTGIGADGAEVLAEMGFTPIDTMGEEKMLCFAASVKLAEDLKPGPEALRQLIDTANEINRFLPIGMVIIDTERGSIIYKVTTIIPSYLPVNDIVMLADTCAGSCYAQANLFIYPFTRLSEGRMTPQEVLEGLLV